MQVYVGGNVYVGNQNPPNNSESSSQDNQSSSESSGQNTEVQLPKEVLKLENTVNFIIIYLNKNIIRTNLNFLYYLNVNYWNFC